MQFLLSEDLATEVTETIAESVSENVQIFNVQMLLEYFRDSMPTVLDFIVKLIIAIIVLLVGRKLIQVARKFIRKMMDKTGWDTGVKQFFDHLVNVALWFVLIMIVLGKFGITASTVIAVIGSVGLSIGLALQGSLSNFAGGVLILLLKPFKVGDYIREDNKGNEGTVKEIQLFYTKLVTLDNQTIVLPNGNLSNGSLVNFSQQDKRRVDVKVGISYHADIRQAKTVLQRVIDAEEKRLVDEPTAVVVSNLGDNAVEITLCLWTKTADYWDVKWRMMENVKYALDENAIEIPFPQVTVSYEAKEQA